MFSDSIMPKVRKVYTPGSQPKLSPGRGRPQKAKERSKAGLSRKHSRTTYTQETLQEAIEAVKKGRMTLRKAAQHYGVPKTTMLDRISERRGEKLGRSTELGAEEEAIIEERLLLLGRWGFPLSKKDLTLLIKDYLDRQGRITRFVNNRPGPDFIEGFLRRHPRLSVRTANLIKRSRAAVSHEEINKFFDNYEAVVAGIPPENQFNFDETCLGDNPGPIQ